MMNAIKFESLSPSGKLLYLQNNLSLLLNHNRCLYAKIHKKDFELLNFYQEFVNSFGIFARLGDIIAYQSLICFFNIWVFVYKIIRTKNTHNVGTKRNL